LIRSTWCGAHCGISRIATRPPFDKSSSRILSGSSFSEVSTAYCMGGVSGFTDSCFFLAMAGWREPRAPSAIEARKRETICKTTFSVHPGRIECGPETASEADRPGALSLQ
jgi:hypothetical protein